MNTKHTALEFTLYDFRGSWGNKEDKETMLKQLNKKLEKIKIKAQIEALEDLMITTSTEEVSHDWCPHEELIQLGDEVEEKITELKKQLK